MKTGISRRQFNAALGWGAAVDSAQRIRSVAPRRVPRKTSRSPRPARPGAKGCGPRLSTRPNSRRRTGVKVTQEFAINSVFTAKAMASCGNPPFSTLAVLQAEANFLALGGCLQDYDLDICTNYKDIIDSAKEPPRGPAEKLVHAVRADRDGARLQHQRGE